MERTCGGVSSGANGPGCIQDYSSSSTIFSNSGCRQIQSDKNWRYISKYIYIYIYISINVHDIFKYYYETAAV